MGVSIFTLVRATFRMVVHPVRASQPDPLYARLWGVQ
jgi:hypothetical protein